MARLKIFNATTGLWEFAGGGDTEPFVGPSAPLTVYDGKMWWDTDDNSLIPQTLDPNVLAVDAAFTSRYVPIAGGVLLTDAAQSSATTATTDITWGTEVSDPDGWISGGIATLTVPAGKGGRYSVTFHSISNLSPGSASACCYINGTPSYVNLFAGIFADVVNISFIRTLVAGDTLKFAVYQTSGASRDFTSRLEIAPV